MKWVFPPVVGSELLIVAKSMCNHSARADQLRDNISSAPSPATHPVFVVLLVDVARSGTFEKAPQPFDRQFKVRSVRTRPSAAPPVA